MAAIRSMIEGLVVARRDGGGVDLELDGDLARILALCSGNAKTPPRDEAGFHCPWLRGPETTDRKNATYRLWCEPGLLFLLTGLSPAPVAEIG
jgi:hypothetical protein